MTREQKKQIKEVVDSLLQLDRSSLLFIKTTIDVLKVKEEAKSRE